MRNLIQAFFAGVAGAMTVVVLIGATSIKTDGSVETDQQLVSNVLRGTPPIVVQSTDRVQNLNADAVDGFDSSAFALASNTYTIAEVDALLTTYHDSRRLFYLSTAENDGRSADSACDTGFHFASLWEILDVSNLRYDTERGLTQLDSGQGPPIVFFGWVRTGGRASSAGVPGIGNCKSLLASSPWSSNSPDDSGTRAYLLPHDPEQTHVDRPEPWTIASAACSSSLPSWCVEDSPGSGCIPEDTAARCQDGIDNDCDTYVDCDDWDCGPFCS